MARELNSEMLQRLQRQYGEMSDEELLGLAASPDDLTEMAQEILRGEMTRRRLEPASHTEVPAGTSREYAPGTKVGVALPDGRVVLNTFYDAIECGEACDALEAHSIEVDVRDVSAEVTGGGSFYGGPPVALQLIVATGDRERSVRILREKMGLFPLQEVEESDEVVDDGTVTPVGYFGTRADAEEVARVLDEAGIWHRVTANEDGTVEDENAFSVEVKEVDLVAAGDVVEKAMGLG